MHPQIQVRQHYIKAIIPFHKFGVTTWVIRLSIKKFLVMIGNKVSTEVSWVRNVKITAIEIQILLKENVEKN